jgi:hypothetical protein
MTNEQRLEERRKINTYAPLEKLEDIARHHVPALSGRVGRNVLDTMDNDADDFFEMSVWGLKEALIEAYLLGERRGHVETKATHKQINDLAIVGINYSIERLKQRVARTVQRIETLDRGKHPQEKFDELHAALMRYQRKIDELAKLRIELKTR